MDISRKKAKRKNSKNPNWLKLPIDLTTNILKRLDTVDLVTNARNVCPLWWNICKDPLVWRTIHITDIHLRAFDFCSLENICRSAIDLSCGHLEDIDIELIVTDELLKYMALRASRLRRLRLYRCDLISDKGLIESVKKFSLLEVLDISFSNKLSKDFLEVIGRCCPFLKSLNLHKLSFIHSSASAKCNDEAFAIAKTMSGIHHLKLSGINFDNVGVLAMLDGCPLLKSLHLHDCHHVYFNGSLFKRCCDQIKVLKLPTYAFDGTYDDDHYDYNDSEIDDDVDYNGPVDDVYDYDDVDYDHFFDDIYDDDGVDYDHIFYDIYDDVDYDDLFDDIYDYGDVDYDGLFVDDDDDDDDDVNDLAYVDTFEDTYANSDWEY